MKPFTLIALTILFGCLVQAQSPSTDPAAGLEFFEQRIRPVLVEHCRECHSASAKKLQGGLRMDSRAGLIAGGDSGPAIVPGKPEASLLIRAVNHADAESAMPPKRPQLSRQARQDLERWVAAGAPWPAGEASESPAKERFDLEGRRKAQA